MIMLIQWYVRNGNRDQETPIICSIDGRWRFLYFLLYSIRLWRMLKSVALEYFSFILRIGES